MGLAMSVRSAKQPDPDCYNMDPSLTKLQIVRVSPLCSFDTEDSCES